MPWFQKTNNYLQERQRAITKLTNTLNQLNLSVSYLKNRKRDILRKGDSQSSRAALKQVNSFILSQEMRIVQLDGFLMATHTMSIWNETTNLAMRHMTNSISKSMMQDTFDDLQDNLDTMNDMFEENLPVEDDFDFEEAWAEFNNTYEDDTIITEQSKKSEENRGWEQKMNLKHETMEHIKNPNKEKLNMKSKSIEQIKETKKEKLKCESSSVKKSKESQEKINTENKRIQKKKLASKSELNGKMEDIYLGLDAPTTKLIHDRDDGTTDRCRDMDRSDRRYNRSAVAL